MPEHGLDEAACLTNEALEYFASLFPKCAARLDAPVQPATTQVPANA